MMYLTGGSCSYVSLIFHEEIRSFSRSQNLLQSSSGSSSSVSCRFIQPRYPVLERMFLLIQDETAPQRRNISSALAFLEGSRGVGYCVAAIMNKLVEVYCGIAGYLIGWVVKVFLVYFFDSIHRV